MASGIIKNTKLNKSKTFDEVFSGEENDLKDFLKRIFVFNPTKRITLKEAFESCGVGSVLSGVAVDLKVVDSVPAPNLFFNSLVGDLTIWQHD